VENELAAGNEASIVPRCKATKQINFPGAHCGLRWQTVCHTRAYEGETLGRLPTKFPSPSQLLNEFHFRLVPCHSAVRKW